MRRICHVAVLALMLQSCVGTGGDPSGLNEPAVVPVTVIAGETVTGGSDDRIILATVVSAPAGGAPETGFPWINNDNGNSGNVTLVTETDEGSSICRSFVVLKQSYDGINQLTGKACRSKSGIVWTLQSLEPRQ